MDSSWRMSRDYCTAKAAACVCHNGNVAWDLARLHIGFHLIHLTSTDLHLSDRFDRDNQFGLLVGITPARFTNYVLGHTVKRRAENHTPRDGFSDALAIRRSSTSELVENRMSALDQPPTAT